MCLCDGSELAMRTWEVTRRRQIRHRYHSGPSQATDYRSWFLRLSIPLRSAPPHPCSSQSPRRKSSAHFRLRPISNGPSHFFSLKSFSSRSSSSSSLSPNISRREIPRSCSFVSGTLFLLLRLVFLIISPLHSCTGIRVRRPRFPRLARASFFYSKDAVSSPVQFRHPFGD